MFAFRKLVSNQTQRTALSCRFPAPASKEDGDKLVALAKEINDKAESKIEDIDESVLRHLASGSSADLSPMAAMLGGVVGQEVVKACSGKFHPLFQVRKRLFMRRVLSVLCVCRAPDKPKQVTC